MQWNIRTKLLTTFALVLVLAAAVGGIGLVNANDLRLAMDKMYQDNLNGVKLVNYARAQMINYSRAVREHIIATDKTEKDSYLALMDEYEQKMSKYLDEYRQTEMEQQEKDLLSQFDQNWPQYTQAISEVLKISALGDSAEAMRVLRVEATPKYKAADDALTALSDLRPDERVVVQILREGRPIEVNVELTPR